MTTTGSTLIIEVVNSNDGFAAGWDLLAHIALAHDMNDRALEFARKALIEDTSTAKYYVTLGNVLKANRDIPKARQNYLKALEIESDYPQALFAIGSLELEQGNLDQGYNYLKHYLEFEPNDAIILNNIGCIAAMSQQTSEAKKYFERAIEINDNYADPQNNLGNLLLHSGDYPKAIEHYQQAIKINPSYSDAFNNLGNAYKALDQNDYARENYRRAIELNSSHCEAINNLGSVFLDDGEYEKACQQFKEALKLQPSFPEAKLNLGICFRLLECYTQARITLEEAILLNPGKWETHYHLGIIFQILRQLDKSLQCFDKVLEINPNNVESLFYSAKIHNLYKNYPKALTLLKRVLAVDSTHLSALALQTYILKKQCQWHAAEESKTALIQHSEKMWEKGEDVYIDPFIAVAIGCDDKFIAKVSKNYASAMQVTSSSPFEGTFKDHQRIKIGYISPDFNQHPIGVHIREMFKFHNRAKFEVYCYSLKQAQENPYTPLIKSSCDHFVDCANSGPLEIASKIYRDEIDILIDCAAFTGDAMPQILAYKPAPIQMHWLGCSQSMQADYVQYYMTHKDLVPDHLREVYSESMIFLPNAPYATQPFNSQLPAVTREQFNLPADAFVFCSFVQSYRMTEATINSWMEILKQTENTVLWLRQDSQEVMDTVLQSAEQHALDKSRIIFNQDQILTEKWQHQLADLWLDPLEFSSGTGTFLSLWAGCPLLSYLGQASTNRIASSLLKAANLSELIVESSKQYIEKAIEFAADRSKVAKLKKDILTNREQLQIFDIKKYVSDLEVAYSKIYQRLRDNEQASDLDLNGQ